jgi:hypothetical protein
MHAREIATLAVALLVGTAGPTLALDCPVRQPTSVLRETPAQLAGLSNYLSTGDVHSKLRAVVADLRTRYPAVPPTELMNYLTTAYCPIAAQAPGSEAQRKALFDQFVQWVEKLTL